MELTDRQLDELISRLEERDKALTGGIARDKILVAQTDIFARLGVKNRELMAAGLREMDLAIASFKRDMVSLVSRFQAGDIDIPTAMKEWKGLTGKYYVDLFKAGGKSAGNPFFDMEKLSGKDMAFISKARRFEAQFFQRFLGDMRDPNFRPTHPFLARAEYYAESAKAQFYNGLVAGAGHEVELYWTLGIAEHCDDCIQLSSGNPYTWETLPTTPRAGDTECLMNCQCHLQVRPAHRTEPTPGAGPETTMPTDAPGHYAIVRDREGREMTGGVLDAAEDLYKQMYKARQMITLTDGPEQREWINLRQQLNRQLVQRMDDMGYRVTPTISVTDLVKTAQDAAAQGIGLPAVTLADAVAGEEVIFIRANFATRGILAYQGGQLVVETATGVTYPYNDNTDILLRLRPALGRATESRISPRRGLTWAELLNTKTRKAPLEEKESAQNLTERPLAFLKASTDGRPFSATILFPLDDWSASGLLERLGTEVEFVEGGPGSGHFGHAGRPGEVGGSLPGEGGEGAGDHLDPHGEGNTPDGYHDAMGPGDPDTPEKYARVETAYGKEIADKAFEVFRKARVDEPEMTQALRQMGTETGMNMIYAQHRIKMPISIAEKIVKLQKEAESKGLPVPSVDEAAGKIKDLIRYTMAINEQDPEAFENFADSAANTKALLDASGWKYIHDSGTNYWFKQAKDGYLGYNAKYYHAATGRTVEIQFHTYQSAQTAHRNHVLYEKARKLPEGDPERFRLDRLQFEAWMVVKRPSGTNKLNSKTPDGEQIN